MQKQSSDSEKFYALLPYAEAFDIGYPQENLEGEMYVYRCRSCKKLTTEINGRLENHADDCEYRRLRTIYERPLV
jgi:DNA-directed RNA polymerase subunit RPC12/RpoP